MKSQPKNLLPYLQILRALAATLVIIDHATAQIIGWKNVPEWIGVFGQFLGEQGVAIFFVISGYIMAHTTRGYGSAMGGLHFFVRRVFRIVPIYWIFSIFAFLLIYFGVWLKGRVVAWPDLIHSLAFIPYGSSPMRPVLGQGWTLEYELFFYVIFAAFMVFSRRVCLVATTTFLLILPILGWVFFDSWNVEAESLLAYFLSPLLILFCCGILLRLFGSKNAFRSPLGVISILTACLIWLFSYSKMGYAQPSWRAVFWSIDVLIVFSALKMMDADVGNSRFRNFLVLVGDASYSMYLTHIFVVYVAARLWRTLIGSQYASAYIAATVMMSVACAIPLYKYIERPLHKGLQKFSDRMFALGVRH